jgi:hypothetical protein
VAPDDNSPDSPTRAEGWIDDALTADAAGADWAGFVEFSGEVVALAYPGERELFDEVLAEFRSDPQGLLTGGRLRPPVGMGVDLALATPYVLSVVSFLIGVVTETATSRVIDALSQATRTKVARLLRRRSKDRATATQNRDGNAELISTPACLDSGQEREVHAVLVERAVAFGLGKAKARYLADSVVGALRLRCEER